VPEPLRLLVLLEWNVRLRAWEEIIPLLRQAGVEVWAGSVFEPGPFQEQVGSLGARPFALRCRTSAGYAAGAARLARIVSRDRIEVIHGTERISAVVGGLAGRLARRGLTVYHRNHHLEGGPKLVLLGRLAARLNAGTLAVSQASARAAQRQERVPSHRLCVAHNGANEPRQVSAQEIDGLRTELGIPADAAIVVIVARLRPAKGIDVLLHALRLVGRPLGRPVHLVIVGDGPEEAVLKELARRVAPGAVHFVGFRFDVAPWYRLADVVAMPSRIEAFGVSAIEAMASGRPLVASRVGGLVEVVADRETGHLVPPNDPQALAAALTGVLEGPERAEATGRAARARYERLFTNRAMVEAWLRCYDEWLTREGRASGRPALRRPRSARPGA
jgi:glycosyltransferase involved in cell wall biosynthesis